MIDSPLIARIQAHYVERGFAPSLLWRLGHEINRRSEASGIRITQGWFVCPDLLFEAFEPVDQTPRPANQQPTPAAIFALSFGYRLESPFSRQTADRTPGPNNIAIANLTERCHELFPEAWIAVQHEVALEIETTRNLEIQL